ncbi:hypothetical protein GIB67_009499 [Kingdonia uniflora]|uniref:KIB1-4 beta-propeller domain-containing protein n=1 Tax=Kingdonia uniflora TaxID=39325 RepID=A0A7J7NWT4_9MAGN|nr:hypothetical protein GIB67_009499 [Kingdonia uniflora]
MKLKKPFGLSRRKNCLGSSYGWIVIQIQRWYADDRYYLSLCHPDDVIQIPSIINKKAIVKLDWHFVETVPRNDPDDAIYYKDPPPIELHRNMIFQEFYLVELSGELLLVIRINKLESWSTVGFQVFKLDPIARKWIEVKTLGEHMIFLGYCSSITFSASDFLGCKPNYIYFASEDRCDTLEGLPEYNIEDGSISDLVESDLVAMAEGPNAIDPAQVLAQQVGGPSVNPRPLNTRTRLDQLEDKMQALSGIIDQVTTLEERLDGFSDDQAHVGERLVTLEGVVEGNMATLLE